MEKKEVRESEVGGQKGCVKLTSDFRGQVCILTSA